MKIKSKFQLRSKNLPILIKYWSLVTTELCPAGTITVQMDVQEETSATLSMQLDMKVTKNTIYFICD